MWNITTSIRQTVGRITGTNSVTQLIVFDSPIRYNKIKEFPICNFPELKPDATYDETGGIRMNSDDSGEIDPDVGEECEADVDDALESLFAILEGDDGEELENSDAGTDILTGNCDDDECDDLPDDDDEDLEDIVECDL